MPALQLYTSNRMETLADQLAAVLRPPLASPFDPETIIVQSRGMERWISMELARRHGICANIRFPFPNTFVREIADQVLVRPLDPSPFDPHVMTWRVMTLLPLLIGKQGFKPLLTYLENTESRLKQFQLSERIADLFDQYLLFRPEMMLNWEKGKEDHWQAVLWRTLAENHENGHRAAQGQALMARLMSPSGSLKNLLPERIAVFGISTLPKFHVQVFAALARHTEVNLFLMNPCREYWSQITSDRQMERIVRKTESETIGPEDLHLDPGNSLLAAMGTLGGEFFDLITEFGVEDFPLFEDIPEQTLLSCVQSDILNLRERGLASGNPLKILLDDRSLQIHSCHSPMREVEVLRDNLLQMFENDPILLPKDILIMTPDVEVYAPFIQAVFDRPLDDPTRIPYSIADQSIRAEGKIIAPFLNIIKLVESRLGAFQVMCVLESKAVMDRFRLSDADVLLIRKWVTETRIRWGMDAGFRGEMGLPDLLENTWKAGLNRLVLGYAMPGYGEKTFHGTLPFDNMEGKETEVLGRFLEFTDQLFVFVKTLHASRNLEEWSQVLKDFLARFFLVDENTAHEMQILQRAIHDLAEQATLSGFDEKVDIRVVQSWLEQRLKKEGFGFGFITGNVTFCAMLPMRSIPFKVIGLIGLNNDAYPRQSNPLGFDLMAVNRQKGEPLRQNDDRYLFLEALLSAREIFYISHVGQSFQDNTPMAPSVLVSELMDYIKHGFSTTDGDILTQIRVQHRLQPFSPEYFKARNKLFSYSKENFVTANRLIEPRKDPISFISQGFPEPDEEWKTIDVDDLCVFFSNPAKFLLKNRLQIRPGEESFLLDETEPFRLEGLDNYQLAQEMVNQRISGANLKNFYPIARAQSLLPLGSVGKAAYENLRMEIETFVEKISLYAHGETLTPFPVDLKISGFHLTGMIRNIYPKWLFQYRYAKIKPGDLFSGWLCHLILNCAAVEDYPQKAMVAGLEDGCVIHAFQQVETPRAILETLLRHYWEGLIRPIHFFPRSSHAYADLVIQKNKSEAEARVKAVGVWTGNQFVRGEMEDPVYQLCFKRINPIDAGFEARALEVFGPMLRHQRTIM